MIADLDETDRSELTGYDLCVVGTGPAARRWCASWSAPGCACACSRAGCAAPVPAATACGWSTARASTSRTTRASAWWAAASTTWAGLSSPLDPADFEHRPRPGCGTRAGPSGPEELARLLRARRRSATASRRSRLLRRRRASAPAQRGRSELQPGWEGLEEKVFLACAEPQNFAREFRDALRIAERVDLCDRRHRAAAGGRGRTHRAAAALVRTRRRAASCDVERAGLRAGHRRHRERAPAAGLSRGPRPRGAGQRAPTRSGRYFMNHPKKLPRRPAPGAPGGRGCPTSSAACFKRLRRLRRAAPAGRRSSASAGLAQQLRAPGAALPLVRQRGRRGPGGPVRQALRRSSCAASRAREEAPRGRGREPARLRRDPATTPSCRTQRKSTCPSGWGSSAKVVARRAAAWRATSGTGWCPAPCQAHDPRRAPAQLHGDGTRPREPRRAAGPRATRMESPCRW